MTADVQSKRAVAPVTAEVKAATGATLAARTLIVCSVVAEPPSLSDGGPDPDSTSMKKYIRAGRYGKAH